MSKAVVRIQGEEKIVGDFSKREPTVKELLKLNQELKNQLIEQMELTREIRNLKVQLSSARRDRNKATEELNELKEALRAQNVNEMLEAVNKILTIRRTIHQVR